MIDDSNTLASETAEGVKKASFKPLQGSSKIKLTAVVDHARGELIHEKKHSPKSGDVPLP